MRRIGGNADAVEDAKDAEDVVVDAEEDWNVEDWNVEDEDDPLPSAWRTRGRGIQGTQCKHAARSQPHPGRSGAPVQ